MNLKFGEFEFVLENLLVEIEIEATKGLFSKLLLIALAVIVEFIIILILLLRFEYNEILS